MEHKQTRYPQNVAQKYKHTFTFLVYKRLVRPSYQCQSRYREASSSYNFPPGCYQPSFSSKAEAWIAHHITKKNPPWVIKALITLHIFMDTIKNKATIKKIADCGLKSPKDPISS